MKILIAYDGSERSDAVLRDLAKAGVGADVQAEVMYVAEVWIPPESAYAGPGLWELAIRDVATKGRNTLTRVVHDVQAAAAKLRERFPTWTVRPEAPTGPAPLRLIERAESWPADLVVAGAQSHVVAERLGLGSVALKLLTHLRCPVRIGRASVGEHDAPRLIIGVDGSLDSDAAVAAVAARTWPAGTEVRAITAIDHRVLVTPQDFNPLPMEAAAAAASRAIADAAANRLRQAGLSATAHVVNGDPKHALVHAAGEWQAECLFVGARGLTRVERFLLGSVSTTVAMRAPCSVEVIHPSIHPSRS
jgi:nucleotide-binding universal stress UspA family protein